MIRHYSSIISICHPFQPLPIPLLRVVLFWSVLLLMLQNYKKIVLISHRLAAFHSQCRWTRIFISLTTPIAMGTQLCLKRHRESHSSSRNLWFRHYYQRLFLQVALYIDPPLRVLEVHINDIMGISIHIPSPKFISAI